MTMQRETALEARGSPASAGAMPTKMLKAKATQAYASQSRESLEEQWILGHLPMVRYIVQKVAAQLSCRDDVDDLISAGTVGLVKAARGFDSSKNAEFKTYAYIRIRGAVIDELRGRSFLPSTVRERVRRVQQAYQRITGERQSPPTDEELAHEAGLTPSQLYRALEGARRDHFLSIHGLSGDGAVLDSLLPPDGGLSPDMEVERKELLEKLAAAIKALPKRDRIIILLYYERDLTMKEAAQVLGLTESRISQLHASALFKLAMRLRTSS